MSLNPGSSFPGQTDAPSGAYPYGKARNVSAPGAGDGTPWAAAVVNDLWGFQQQLLSAAGITPSGTPDEVGDSQYFDALVALFDQSAAATLLAPGLVQLSNDTGSSSNSLAATIGALNALRTIVSAITPALSPVVSGTGANWCVKIGKFKIQGGTVTVRHTTTNVIFSGAQSAYTGVHAAFMPWMINDADNSSGYNNEPISGGVVSPSTGKVHCNSGQDNLCGYIAIGWDV